MQIPDTPYATNKAGSSYKICRIDREGFFLTIAVHFFEAHRPASPTIQHKLLDQSEVYNLFT